MAAEPPAVEGSGAAVAMCVSGAQSDHCSLAVSVLVLLLTCLSPINQSINKSVNLAWPFTTALVSGVAASRPSQRVSSRVESRVIVFQVKSSLKFLSLCPSQVQVVKI